MSLSEKCIADIEENISYLKENQKGKFKFLCKTKGFAEDETITSIDNYVESLHCALKGE